MLAAGAEVLQVALDGGIGRDYGWHVGLTRGGERRLPERDWEEGKLRGSDRLSPTVLVAELSNHHCAPVPMFVLRNGAFGGRSQRSETLTGSSWEAEKRSDTCCDKRVSLSRAMAALKQG